MTEEKSNTIVELPPPVRCTLWEHPEKADAEFAEILEEVQSYEDTSHLTRALYKCRECGQLYFYEWYEWVDWGGGNDRSYSTLLPVQTQEQIEALKQTDIFGLMRYFPRLHLDEREPTWRGKS